MTGTRLAAFIVSLSLASLAIAAPYLLPRESAVPGGVKLIRLEYKGSAMPAVDVDGQRAMVVQDATGWVAVIGIPLSAPLAARSVVVHDADGRQQVEFSIGKKLLPVPHPRSSRRVPLSPCSRASASRRSSQRS